RGHAQGSRPRGVVIVDRLDPAGVVAGRSRSERVDSGAGDGREAPDGLRDRDFPRAAVRECGGAGAGGWGPGAGDLGGGDAGGVGGGAVIGLRGRLLLLVVEVRRQSFGRRNPPNAHKRRLPALTCRVLGAIGDKARHVSVGPGRFCAKWAFGAQAALPKPRSTLLGALS